MNNKRADKHFYNMEHWGAGYFHINAQGNVEVRKEGAISGVELQTIVNSAAQFGLNLPLLIRFTDILHARIDHLYLAFAQAIAATRYQGQYQLVFPIKVNQEFSVIDCLLQNPKHSIGLEAGSKPELMAVIGLLNQERATIICNGYKDNAYIRAALIAQSMGHQVFIIIEKRAELNIIIQEALQMRIKPRVGVRIRLTTTCHGKWEHTGGVKSKFGLNAEQVMDLVQQLKAHDFLDCLQLMHCHLGSQIANLQDIAACMQEVVQYYIELHRLQVPIQIIDVGGGLAVDYEGTHSSNDCSMNYDLCEYATQILRSVAGACLKENLPQPNIISESGRALTAHHAVLITNITDIETVDTDYAKTSIMPGDTDLIRDMENIYQAITRVSGLVSYQQAQAILNHSQLLYSQGDMNLAEKAKIEQMFAVICYVVLNKLDSNIVFESALIDEINERLATKFFCNLSFFQSLPDAWAIGQIFPIVPITQLFEQPNLHGILQDLTCDSDGTLKCYTGQSTIKSTLLLPPYDPQKPYHLAFFLVGAYQEILGNLHNLFGDTNSLDIALLDNGTFKISHLVHGDTVSAVLKAAHFSTEGLLRSCEAQLHLTNLSKRDKQAYLAELHAIFKQLTYLDSQRSQPLVTIDTAERGLKNGTAIPLELMV